MSEAQGMPDGLVILVVAVNEALERCQYDGNSFYHRVGGLQGLIQLLLLGKKEHGIGPKTCEVVEMVKRLVVEAVVKDAESRL